MNKFEKMWKILKKECVKNKGKGAKSDSKRIPQSNPEAR